MDYQVCLGPAQHLDSWAINVEKELAGVIGAQLYKQGARGYVPRFEMKQVVGTSRPKSLIMAAAARPWRWLHDRASEVVFGAGQGSRQVLEATLLDLRNPPPLVKECPGSQGPLVGTMQAFSFTDLLFLRTFTVGGI